MAKGIMVGGAKRRSEVSGGYGPLPEMNIGLIGMVATFYFAAPRSAKAGPKSKEIING